MVSGAPVSPHAVEGYARKLEIAGGVQVVGVVGKDLEDAAAEEVLAPGHGGLKKGVAYRDDLEVGCEDQEEAGQRLEESLQYGAAAAQFVFNRPALGDVANGARNQHAFLGLERAEADLDGELGAILAQRVQFHAGPHGPHPRIGEKTRAVPRMVVPEAFRHQHLNGLPQQLFPRVSKQLLHLRVDQDDLALLDSPPPRRPAQLPASPGILPRRASGR